MNPHRLLIGLLLAVPCIVGAQVPATVASANFPERAEPLDESALRERLAGKVFRMDFGGGTSVRLDIRANGYAYVDTSGGFRDAGRWHVKGSAWCDDWNRSQAASGCNEVRTLDGLLLLKRRSNGQVVVLRA